MRVMNKGQRSYILNKSDVISGGDIVSTANGERVYFTAGTVADIRQDAAIKLCAGYSDLMLLDEPKQVVPAPVEPVVEAPADVPEAPKEETDKLADVPETLEEDPVVEVSEEVEKPKRKRGGKK